MTHINIDNLLKKRGNITLSCEHIDLNHGFIYSVYGMNGSGKSSLLKLLAGVIKPELGKIQGMGRVAYIPSESDLLLGFSRKNLVQHFRVFNNRFNLKKFEDLLFKFKLFGFDHMDKLSKGERKCILLSLSLSQNPDTLILDEPLNGLDSSNKEIVLQILQEYVLDTNKTIIMAVNQFDDIVGISDYFIQVIKGRINQPLNSVELQEKYSVIKVQNEDSLLDEGNYLAKHRTESGFRLLVENNDNHSSDLIEILEMLGGIGDVK